MMFSKSKEIAKILAAQFAHDFPPSLQRLSGRKTQDAYQRAIINLDKKTRQAQLEYKFGIFSRIALTRTFQDNIRELNFLPAIQRESTSVVATALTFADK